jgi:hypothetical protein
LFVSVGAGDGQDLGRQLFICLLVALAIRVGRPLARVCFSFLRVTPFF